MNDFILYCPKCGKKLTDYYYGYLKLYRCENPACDYKNKLTENTIDISYASNGISKALSNLCPYSFVIDSVRCASMESFLQSLKVKDIKLQIEICSLPGIFCNKIKDVYNDWKETQIVYWQGKEINRLSDEYSILIKRAYMDLYNQSVMFRYALSNSKDYNLIHSIGYNDKSETLLTQEEFISNLNFLRDIE